jgi:gamma-glutamyltranspeptidase
VPALRLLLEGTPVQDAVGSPRIHDQLLPSQDALYEAYTWGHTQHELPEPAVEALQQRGQHPVPQAFGLGVSQAIVVDYSPETAGQGMQEGTAGAAAPEEDSEDASSSSSSQPEGVLRGMSDARKDGAASGY